MSRFFCIVCTSYILNILITLCTPLSWGCLIYGMWSDSSVTNSAISSWLSSNVYTTVSLCVYTYITCISSVSGTNHKENHCNWYRYRLVLATSNPSLSTLIRYISCIVLYSYRAYQPITMISNSTHHQSCLDNDNHNKNITKIAATDHRRIGLSYFSHWYTWSLVMCGDW